MENKMTSRTTEHGTLQRRVSQILALTGLLLTGLFASGCTIEETDTSKISDVDYTIVTEDEIPSELMPQIEEGQNTELKLTYSDGEYLYIVRGYGEQPAGSSIQVLELYQTTNAICIDTQLLGGGESAEKQTTSAYPYIVVKLPSGEQNVVFE